MSLTSDLWGQMKGEKRENSFLERKAHLTQFYLLFCAVYQVCSGVDVTVLCPVALCFPVFCLE